MVKEAFVKSLANLPIQEYRNNQSASSAQGPK